MQWVSRFLPRVAAAPTIYHVSEGADWVLKWVAEYTAQELTRQHLRTVALVQPWRLRGQVIHFIDRYMLFQNWQRVHPSNRIFVTWMHGDPQQPDFAEAGNTLKMLLPRLEKIITPTHTGQHQLMAAGIPAEKIMVIPLGVDTHRFHLPLPQARAAMRAKLGIPDDAFCIGSFQKDGSGWGEGSDPKLIKGPDIFLQVLEKLFQQQPTIFVVLTGSARGYVKQGLDRLGIPYVHHFLPHYFDVVPYYYALDAYLITARAEGGPMGLMESWASGVPVVSTNMGMPADWIVHGKNGLLAEVADTDRLAAYLLALRDDPHLQSRLMLGGLHTVTQLDWSLIVEKYYAPLYRQLLA
jgi:glycosyltransferase involved in cell wall biosynthesis